MLTFDFICISVLRATPDAKVFFHFTSRGFSLSVAQLWLWSAHPGVWWFERRWRTSGGQQEVLFFSPLDNPAVRSWCQGRTEKGSFRVCFFFFVFFFVVVFFSVHIMRWKSEIVMLLCLRFLLCWQNRVHLAVCELFIYLSPPPTPATPRPHHPPREHLTLPYFLPYCEELQKAGNGFNTTRAGVWTLLIDELRFIATRVAA